MLRSLQVCYRNDCQLINTEDCQDYSEVSDIPLRIDTQNLFHHPFHVQPPYYHQTFPFPRLKCQLTQTHNYGLLRINRERPSPWSWFDSERNVVSVTHGVVTKERVLKFKRRCQLFVSCKLILHLQREDEKRRKKTISLSLGLRRLTDLQTTNIVLPYFVVRTHHQVSELLRMKFACQKVLSNDTC